MLIVHLAQQSRGGGKHVINKDKDRLLRVKLDPLANHVDELAHAKVLRHQILALVDGSNVAFIDFLADDGNAAGVLLADPIRFSLAGLEWVVVFEL